jgi:hypothetical protein
LTEAQPTFPPMHPVTRLGRVIQQLRSFGDLHANELEAMAQELERAGASEVAANLRVYRDVQRDEAQMVVDELVDIQNDMAAAPPGQPAQPGDLPPLQPLPAAGHDPAINSPRRARWLAEQAAEAERLRQPRMRRDLLSRQKSDVRSQPGFGNEASEF